MREQPQIDRPDLKKRLPKIQSLAMLKMEKNFIAYCEKNYPRQPYKELPPTYLLKRILDETEELTIAISQKNIRGILEECADVSNLIDYLYELVLSYIIQSG